MAASETAIFWKNSTEFCRFVTPAASTMDATDRKLLALLRGIRAMDGVSKSETSLLLTTL